MYIYNEVNHEAGHELTGYKGLDAHGNDIKVSPEEQGNANQCGYEAGLYIENKTYGIYTQMSTEKSSEPNLKPFENIISINAKFKKGTMEDAYNKANSTDEGQKTLPTVPK